MVAVELTEEQLKALIQLIDVSQIRGKDVEFVAELKKALKGALPEGAE